MSRRLTVYSTPWCGHCHRLKSQLARAGIDFDEVDIETDPDAAALVERVNNGTQTVPTVIFSDGSALTNPRLSDVTKRLATAQV